MPNYINDDTALPADRVDRRPIPPGESETKFTKAVYHNAIKQFCEDARDAIQAIQTAPVVVDGTTITGAGTTLSPLVSVGGGGGVTSVTAGANLTGGGTGAVTLNVASNPRFGSTTDGETYIVDNAVNGQYSTDTEDAQLRLNFHGYQDGVTRFRATVIYNGKGSALVTVDGSASNVNLAANLNVNGGNVTVLSGALVTIGSATSFTNGNTTTFSGPLRVGTSGPTIQSGTGDPNGSVSAAAGSIFLRTDGGAGSTMYVRETGTATNWTAK
jgi:hypothetical protein